MDSLRGELRGAVRAAARALVYRVPGECDRCPSCGSPRIDVLDLLPLRRPVGSCGTGFVSGCEACGLVFSNPQPTPEELTRFYSPTGEWGSRRVSDSGHTVEPHETTRGRSWSRVFGPIRDLVVSPARDARALDFGCGRGKLLDALQECGWDTFGMETAVDGAFPRHHRLDAVPGTPMFDLIVVNHVFEHTANPLGLLRQFARASRPGGYLFVGVPRLDTLPVHRDYKYVINGRAHVTAYTWPCLEGLLARTGWKAVAPPPEWIPKGGGRQTCARLRVIARRVEEYVTPSPPPADAARRAIRRYHAGVPGRSLFERLGLYRLAARSAEARRRRAIRIRKSGKATVFERDLPAATTSLGAARDAPSENRGAAQPGNDFEETRN